MYNVLVIDFKIFGILGYWMILDCCVFLNVKNYFWKNKIVIIV